MFLVRLDSSGHSKTGLAAVRLRGGSLSYGSHALVMLGLQDHMVLTNS